MDDVEGCFEARAVVRVVLFERDDERVARLGEEVVEAGGDQAVFPYCGLLEAIVFLIATIALIVDAMFASELMFSALDSLRDPRIALVAQVNREIERDPGTAEAYRRVGFLLERSTDPTGTPHWKVSGYVPTASVK